METVRVGFVGAGGVANWLHYPSLAQMPDVKIQAISELNEERMRKTAEKYKVEGTFPNYREMLAKAEIDAVYVIMPPHHLFDIVIQCLNAKKHVFIEKPPGVTREQTYQMAKCAERNGALTMVGFNRRFIPVMLKARQIVEERGPIIHCLATFYKNHDKPFWDGAVDILTADGIHSVDMLRWMGGEVKSVASSVGRYYMDAADAFNAVLKFDGGATGLLVTNWAVGGRQHTFEMHAKGISAFCNPDEKVLIYKDNKPEPEVLKADEVAGSKDKLKFYGFFGENRHFIDCVKAGRQPQTHFGDAVKTMELVDRIFRSQI
jgi:predicted dehydrogenase